MLKTLKITSSSFTTAGVKELNEDSAAIELPSDAYLLSSKGVVACVADGVSSAEAGREASNTAVSRFIEEYFQTPDTWSVSRCGEKILSTLNLRLYRKSHEFVTSTKGYLCTFSAIVVKSRTAHFFHVGDSRIYKLSKQEDAVSFVRRMAQGRLDIARDEQRRRAENLPTSNTATDLAGVFGQEHGGGSARPPRETNIATDHPLVIELEQLCERVGFGSIRTLDIDGLQSAIDELGAFENARSGERRSLFDEIDALTAELVKRYKDGGANVDALLNDES